MAKQRITIKNEDLEAYSPYTGLLCAVDGCVNIDDVSLIYVYIKEAAEFEFIREGYTHLEKLDEPEFGDDDIDLVIELDDGIAGSNIFIGYKQP